MNQIEKAISALEEGEKYIPETTDYYVLMSDLYVAQKDTTKAKWAIQKAIKISPEDESIRLKESLIK